MFVALNRANACGCLEATAQALRAGWQHATGLLHTSVGSSAGIKAKKTVEVDKDQVLESELYWLQPVLYNQSVLSKPGHGWMYKITRASPQDYSDSIKELSHSTRNQQDASGKGVRKSGKQASAASKKTSPKNPVTAYNVFTSMKYAEVKKKNPTKTFHEHSKILANMWRTATPHEMTHCDQVAAADQDRYERELLELRWGDKGAAGDFIAASEEKDIQKTSKGKRPVPVVPAGSASRAPSKGKPAKGAAPTAQPGARMRRSAEKLEA